MGIICKNIIEIFYYERIIEVNTGDSSEYLNKTLFSLQIGHFYPKLGSKPRTLFSRNQP